MTAAADRSARIVTEVVAAAVLLAVQLVLIGWRADGSPWWGLAGAVFAAAVPLAFILRGVRRGSYADHHGPHRAHRRTPLLVALASVTAGLVLLIVLGAPRDVVALLASGIAGLVVFGTITGWWKISLNAGVAAGTVAVLAVAFGPPAPAGPPVPAALPVLAGLPAVVLVCWSRVRLGAHTPAQVIAGAAVGALVAGTVFAAVR